MAKAVVFLGEGFEEIEALTVVDVLRRGQIECHMCSLKGESVKGAHEIEVNVDMSIEEFNEDDYDAIILPGGMPGADNLKRCSKIIETIKSFKEKEKLICAICAAPMVLGYSNVLQGVNATCYPGFEEYLNGANYVDKKVVVHNNIITSKGPATAIYFALEILKKLASEEIAKGHKDSMMVTFMEQSKE